MRCLRNMAPHLTNKGLFPVKAFIPDLAPFNNPNVRTTRVAIDSTTLETLVHNPIDKTDMYTTITKDGSVLTPVPRRCIRPGEMDLMAKKLAGLELNDRWGGWDCSPFTARSSDQISVYEGA